MPSLFDIDQFQGLRRSERGDEPSMGGLRFALHGGSAFRFALRHTTASGQGAQLIDLFDLAPFTATINLHYSGSVLDRDVVSQYVLRRVPNADCFRWVIRAKEPLDGSDYSTGIPARHIFLTEDELIDPFEGLSDIKDKRFRYSRNESLLRSPRLEDLEVFSALLYLQTLFEAGIQSEELFNEQPGVGAAAAVFADAATFQTREVLRRSSHLRSRLAYFLINCRSATSAETFSAARQRFGLGAFLENLLGLPSISKLAQYCLDPRDTSAFILTSSAPLGRNLHRLPFVAAAKIGKSDRPFSRLSKRLGASQNILLASPTVIIRHGRAPLACNTPLGTAEFVHFFFSPAALAFKPAVEKFGDSDLSGVLSFQPWPLHRFFPSYAPSFSLPCVVQRPRNPTGAMLSGALLVRVNALGLLENLPQWPLGMSARFVVIGLTNNLETTEHRFLFGWRRILAIIKAFFSRMRLSQPTDTT